MENRFVSSWRRFVPVQTSKVVGTLPSRNLWSSRWVFLARTNYRTWYSKPLYRRCDSRFFQDTVLHSFKQWNNGIIKKQISYITTSSTIMPSSDSRHWALSNRLINQRAYHSSNSTSQAGVYIWAANRKTCFLWWGIHLPRTCLSIVDLLHKLTSDHMPWILNGQKQRTRVNDSFLRESSSSRHSILGLWTSCSQVWGWSWVFEKCSLESGD